MNPQAQFLQPKVPPDPVMDSGMEAMGKPVPFFRKQNAYDQCKLMGVRAEHCYPCVNEVATALERDKPYEALEAGMKYLDLTGTYRLFAYLLTGDRT